MKTEKIPYLILFYDIRYSISPKGDTPFRSNTVGTFKKVAPIHRVMTIVCISVNSIKMYSKQREKVVQIGEVPIRMQSIAKFTIAKQDSFGIL